MRIPSSFRLMAHTITVKAIPAVRWKHTDCVGLYDHERQRIEIKAGHGTMPAHIFTHELTHAILTAMGSKLNEDESFVDNFSGLLQQAFESSKYPRQLRRTRKKN